MDRSWMPTVAGVLCIICGCFALFGFIMMSAFGAVFYFAPDVDPEEFVVTFIQIAFAVGAVASLVLGSTAIFGGISVLRSRSWGWILAGAIAATLVCVPLGVAALILIVLSEAELRPAAVG